MDDTMERVPEGFLRQYEEELRPAPFSVDDLVGGGRRRVRRRRGAVAGAAMLAVALAVGAGLGVQALRPERGAAVPAGSVRSGLVGCGGTPEPCAPLVRQWARTELGVDLPAGARFVRGPVAGSPSASTWSFRASGADPEVKGQRLEVAVTLSDREVVPDGAGVRGADVGTTGGALPPAARFTRTGGPLGGERRWTAWTVPADAGRPVLTVLVTAVNSAGAASLPNALTDVAVAHLVWGVDTATPPPGTAGCVARPESCVSVVAEWSRRVAHSTATVGTEAADASEPGTVVIQQKVSSVPGLQDVHLSVVIAPTTTEPKVGSGLPYGPDPVSLPGIPGQAGRLTANGGGNLVESYRLPSTGSRPAVELVLNAANQGPVGGSYSETSDDVRAPAWWTEANVADLLTRLYGTDAVRRAAQASTSEQGAVGTSGSATGTGPR
ncbi:hypothetical protein [Phycicoccus ginsengisoli]